MSNLANQPAFPGGESYVQYDLGGNRTECAKAPLHKGMTLRQHYAGLAMQSIRPDCYSEISDHAKHAVALADALIAELKKSSS